MELTISEYNDLADRYQDTKKKSIMNILMCGKILQEAKEKIVYGEFLKFLKDTRVSESDRTAERLMVIYRNFGHLLEGSDKIKQISMLSMSHMLELRNLPDRFKKELTIEKDTVKGKVTETVKVIDEDKLVEFLEQRVQFEGQSTALRDVPSTELKKYINEANGVFEPQSHFNDETEEDENAEPVEVLEHRDDVLPKIKPSSEVEVYGFGPNRYKEVVGGIASLYRELLKAKEYLPKIDLPMIASLSDTQSESLKRDLEKIKQETIEIQSTVDNLIVRW
jgi:F0F1-type ATP synthase delta subunit